MAESKTACPQTPQRTGQRLQMLVDSLNDRFSLEIRNPQVFSPSTADRADIRWRAYAGISKLYWDRNLDLDSVITAFEEWAETRNEPNDCAAASRRNQLLDNRGRQLISQAERDQRLKYLADLIRDALYLSNESSFVSGVDTNEVSARDEHPSPSKRKRSCSMDDDGFHTAPTSPVKGPRGGDTSTVEPPTDLNISPHIFQSQSNAAQMKPTKFVERLMAPDNIQRYDAPTLVTNRPDVSFDSTTNTSFNDTRQLDTSFASTVTNITEPDLESSYGESVAEQINQMVQSDLDQMLQPVKQRDTAQDADTEHDYSIEGQIMDDLINHGPFTLEQSISSSVGFGYRYELERIGRAWNIPLNQMLVGDKISFKTHEEFWKWIEGHSMRDGKPLPVKSTSAAWDAAVGNFRTDNHSEAIALTGELDCERTCRFYRRFGSDRFLSITLPAPSRPPAHLRVRENPALLRETLAQWLTQRVHCCLGRTWKAFYVEEVKTKNKSKKIEPKFRVHFFAIYDGVDPAGIFLNTRVVAHVGEESENRTPMSIDALINWHMPLAHNRKQTNCKLFQRLSLGLSKTLATVVLRPDQVFHLKDTPNRPVMNDGCALMSRGLANQICDSLGITGSTPSCFQGRIAGAKGLWMVDKHQSHVSTSDIWIQISDSQLKIQPHPQYWEGRVDDERLTFEVVKWSKPLHPVALNTQLLAILQYGGPVKDRIAALTRSGIRSLFESYAEVLEKDSPELCRVFIQRIMPANEESSSLMSQRVRRMEEWMANDAEAVIRFTEAGFSPRSFPPLRQRLRKCLLNKLNQYVAELHIDVPSSTYAFCIADPYGVLAPDEVHFGFSSNWRDPQNQFEDNQLEGMDVLVGRLPAHLPSDIQRRRAVWKPELRHFKDVIVFPSTGDVPLAHMLSGGDYDGDAPWICWDQEIVQNFHSSSLPAEIPPPEHFELQSYTVPMESMSVDEFLESSFTFNLTLSNLGRCTVEHEKIVYDESIDSRHAMELACLLGYLVDGRKAGVHLSEGAFQKVRKRISPIARDLPAYKNPNRRRKPTNIIDYLKFWVAKDEEGAVLRELERLYPSQDLSPDEHLLRPWKRAQEAAEIDKRTGDGKLRVALDHMEREIKELRARWGNLISEQKFCPAALETTERARALPPPTENNGDHTLMHVWRSCPDLWTQVVASYTYQKYPRTTFTMHAFGEVLCQIKTSMVSARSVTNKMLSCYRPNPKVVARMTASDGTADENSEADGEEYEGHEAIEAMLYGTQTAGGYYDPDDRMSVE